MEKIIKIIKKTLPNNIVEFLRYIYFKSKRAKYQIRWLLDYGHLDFFNDFNIEINTSCNRRCKYCPNSVFNRGLIKNEKLMDEKLFKKIIDDLSKIKFSGRVSPQFYGEPLLDKRIFKLMGYVRKKLPKAKIVLVTNGDYLTVKNFDRLNSIGIDEFMITQHGRFMSKNIKELFEYLKDKGTLKKKIEYNHFEENTPLFNRGGLVNPKVVSYHPRCADPCSPVCIDYAGNVVLCCNDYFSSIKFGNVKEQNLVDIWFNKQFKEVRKNLRKKNFTIPICRKCVGLDK